MALTKNDIAERIREELGFPKNQSIDITDSLLELIKCSLDAGDRVLVGSSPRE